MSEPSQEIIEIAKQALSGADISDITAEQKAQLAELYKNHQINHIAAEMLADDQVIHQTIQIDGQDLNVDVHRIQSHMGTYMHIANATIGFVNGTLVPPTYVDSSTNAAPMQIEESPEESKWTISQDKKGNTTITFKNPDDVNPENLEKAIQEVVDLAKNNNNIAAGDIKVDFGNGHIANPGMDILLINDEAINISEAANLFFDDFISPSQGPTELINDSFWDDNESKVPDADLQSLNIQNYEFMAGDLSAFIDLKQETPKEEIGPNLGQSTPPSMKA